MNPPPMVTLPLAFYILIGAAILLLGASLLRRTRTGDTKPELPRRRVPITDDERELRRARTDAVQAQAALSPSYLHARLGPYEAELSELLELALELDDAEGDHAQPHP
jgi:hypothetical protein